MDYYCFPTITGDLSVFLDLDQYTNSNERGFYERTQKSVMLAKNKVNYYYMIYGPKLLLTVMERQSISKEKKSFQDVKFKNQRSCLMQLKKMVEIP